MRAPFRFGFVAAALIQGFVLSGCPDDVIVEEVKFDMKVEPVQVDIGNVQVGTSAQKEFFVRNTAAGLFSVSIERGSPFDDAFTFEIDHAEIPAAGIAKVTVTFSPTDPGVRTGTLVVRPNTDKLNPVEVSLMGTGVETCLLYTSPSPRDGLLSRMPSSA